ncbi:MAG: AsnC family transcriptional regulator [Desulfovibrionaceae bacterium]|nr:AsnC family transcriptional regulator [Desulfovibrionaceae bacterium]
MATQIDDLDRRILDIIQADFPLVPRPYAELGERLGVCEEEVFARVRNLRKSGVIRQLSANFCAPRLGYVSTLCAAKVPQNALESFVSEVNALSGVTHNYVRANAYNVWFTLIAPSREDAAAIIAGLTERTGIEVLNLPAETIYKIHVNFQMKQ